MVSMMKKYEKLEDVPDNIRKEINKKIRDELKERIEKRRPLINISQPNKTTIKVSNTLRGKLAEIGNKDETFEDVIWRLIRRAEPERSGEIVTSKSSAIQYKRKKEFVELIMDVVDSYEIVSDKETRSIMKSKKVGVEYEYNIPPKKEGEWELDIKILKVYYGEKTRNPSEFFGVDNEHKHLSNEFIQIYFKILAEIFIKEFGITKLKYLFDHLSILEWRKVYYENKLSQESFINDVEDVLRNFSERKIDDKVKKQLENSAVGH